MATVFAPGIGTSGFAWIWPGVRRSITRSTWCAVASVAAPAAVILSSDSVRISRLAATVRPSTPVNAPSSRPLTRPGTSVMRWSLAVGAGWSAGSAAAGAAG
ncbi:hypothetical protein CMMCAS04_00250 [Clavibacter michiganensis subsp. michiganensis]|nr:hypothetical protein CMMCAS04_00250 [Clavibacter michiganensis subsp. michiganensis]